MRTIIQAAARGTALTAACLAGLAASPAFAVPTSVLLHPGGALIHEEFSIKPEQDGRTLRFLLPADADPQSIDVTAGTNDIELHYMTPGLIPSAIISIASVAAFCAWRAFENRRHRTRATSGKRAAQ